MNKQEFFTEMKRKAQERAAFFAVAEMAMTTDEDYKINGFSNKEIQRRKKTLNENAGYIDETWSEVKLADFFKEKPELKSFYQWKKKNNVN